MQTMNETGNSKIELRDAARQQLTDGLVTAFAADGRDTTIGPHLGAWIRQAALLLSVQKWETLRKRKFQPTAEEFRAYFDYNPETGEFFYARERYHGRHKKGERTAQRPNSDGYLNVSMNSYRYPAHRVAWLYVHGEWPKGFIDHINGIRHDNRIANLRDVTPEQNTHNRRDPVRGKAGLPGVSTYTRKGTGEPFYVAFISVKGKKKYIGAFDDPMAAHLAYVKVKRELHSGYVN